MLFEQLETRELLACSEELIYDDGVAVRVTLCPDEIETAASIAVTVNGVEKGTGDQVRVYHATAPKSGDWRQVLVLDTNGYFRPRHPDADTPAGSEDRPGTSVILPPGIITTDGSQEQFFLKEQITSIDVVTNDPNGLRLQVAGVPANDTTALPSVQVQWDILLPPTTPTTGQPRGEDLSRVQVAVTATFTEDVFLSEQRMAQRQAFQVARFSSSNVPPEETSGGIRTHDADQLRLLSDDGRISPALDLNAAPANTLLFGNGLPFSGTVELNQVHPAPLNNDPPNFSLRVSSSETGVEYNVQAFLTVEEDAVEKTDENSDNLAVWLNRTFANLRIPAGTVLQWTVDVVARDEIQPSSSLRFLLDAANAYSLSGNAVDLGLPTVPIYMDFNAGGVYTANVYTGGLDNDPQAGNDPDAGRGTSSFRMTLDAVGNNGFVIFDLGTNWARADVDYGDATALRYMAKGDAAGQQLEVKVILPGGNAVIATHTLSTTWHQYELALPEGMLDRDVEQVHFVLNPADNQGQGTVRLDEVRLQTEGFDPLRTLPSYRPGRCDPSAANVRDCEVYPSQAFLYDQALAIIAMQKSNQAVAQQTAVELTEAVLWMVESNGAVTDVLPVGHVLTGTGEPRPGPGDGTQRLGDNAWFGLALLADYEQTGQGKYLDAARGISDWAESNLKDTGPLGGYYGGLDGAGSRLPFRATEHNIDLFCLNRQLAQDLAALGDPSAGDYALRARHAGDFVIRMFDETSGAPGKFWAGTSEGDTINQVSVPLDVQLWAVLAMSNAPDFAPAIDWRRPVQWVKANLRETDGSVQGYAYSSNAKAGAPNRVWYEGTAYAAVVAEVTGQAGVAELLQTLNAARPAEVNAEGLPAASRDGLVDPLLGDVAYDHREHVGATAWAYFAEQAINPFPCGPTLNRDNHPWHNARAAMDVNNDGEIAPLDVLVIVNDINSHDSRSLPVPVSPPVLPPPYLDVSGEDEVTPQDVLIVINDLNAHGSRPVSSTLLNPGAGEAANFASGSKGNQAEGESAGRVENLPTEIGFARRFAMNTPAPGGSTFAIRLDSVWRPGFNDGCLGEIGGLEAGPTAGDESSVAANPVPASPAARSLKPLASANQPPLTDEFYRVLGSDCIDELAVGPWPWREVEASATRP